MKTYHLIVKTKQRDDSISAIGEALDTLQVCTRETPVEGKANIAVIKLIADYLGVAKSKISIKSGAHSKTKTITINTD